MAEIAIKPMGSIAAVINPLNRDEVLLFYCTTTLNVAVEHRPLNPAAQSTTYVDNNIAYGNIRQPGDFGAVIHNNLVQCYGITNFTSYQTPQSAASCISPAINPLDTIQTSTNSAATSNCLVGQYSALAATSDGKFNDYIVFCTPKSTSTTPTSTTAPTPLLVEYTMTLDTPSNTSYPQPSGMLDPASRLTCCFRSDDPSGNRYIFGQSNQQGNGIFYFSTDSGFSQPVPQTNNAAIGNPMSVTTAMVDGLMNMYLFYMDNANMLQRVAYDARAQRWITSSGAVAGPIQPGSGITAVNNGRSCFVFYARPGASTYTMKEVAM